MLTLGLTPVSHGSFWDSDVDMDTVCLPELVVCGSSGGRTVSLLVQSEHLKSCSLLCTFVVTCYSIIFWVGVSVRYLLYVCMFLWL